MKELEEIIKELPENIRLPIYEAFQVFQKDILHKDLQEIREEIKNVWKAIKELAEAQKKTEEELRKLAESHYKLVEEHRKTRQKLEGLSDAFGYTLEDRAIKSLPEILSKDYKIKVIGKLKRTYLKIGKEYIEVNIYGKGRKHGKEYTIIGEAKSRISKKEIDKFIAKCEKISKKSIKIIISYIFTPQVEEYAKEKEIIIIPSYELI